MSVIYVQSVLFLFLLWSAGCAKQTPPPPVPPPLRTHASLATGSPLSGPIASTQPTPTSVRQVDVQWLALEKTPAGLLSPIDSVATLTLSPGSGTPVLAASRITRPVRFGSGEAAEKFASRLGAGTIPLASASSLIAPGATRKFIAADHAAALSVAIHPGADTAMLAVSLTGSPGKTTDRVQETVILDDIPLKAGSTFAVVSPFKWAGTKWQSLALIARVSEPASAAEALADYNRQLQAALDSARNAATPADAAMTSALASLDRKRSYRAPLLLITNLAGARIAGDFALAADDKLLASFADEVGRAYPANAAPPTAQLQWHLDRTAVLWMCNLSQRNALPAELASVMAAHTGDLSRRPDSLGDLAAACSSSDELSQRLIAENYIALEDSSPASRVRAFDWLTSHNKAPAGFDPLADAKARRAAIDRAVDAPVVAP